MMAAIRSERNRLCNFPRTIQVVCAIDVGNKKSTDDATEDIQNRKWRLSEIAFTCNIGMIINYVLLYCVYTCRRTVGEKQSIGQRIVYSLQFDGSWAVVIFGPAVTLYWLLYTCTARASCSFRGRFRCAHPGGYWVGRMEEWENPSWI